MRPSIPAVLQVPPVEEWRLVGDRLQASVAVQPGRRYRIKLLTSTGGVVSHPRTAFARPGRHRNRLAGGRNASPGGAPNHPAMPAVRVRHRDGRVVGSLSYRLGRSLLTDGDFSSGTWGQVGNCAASPWVSAPARLAARVLRGQGPAGRPTLALSADANSACELRALSWRSGRLFISLWVRNVGGAAPRLCLWQLPIKACAAMAPLPPRSALSRWYHYQTIVTPDPRAGSLMIFLYASVYTPGARTTNEYSNIVIRRSPALLQPVIVATAPKQRRPAPALDAVDEGFSADWIGPPEDQRVEVDGLRDGWLGPSSRQVPVRFGPSSWYSLSCFSSLLAAGLLLALGLLRRRGLRRRRPQPKNG